MSDKTSAIFGGELPASNLTLYSTAAAGTSDYISFKTGSQVEALKIDTSGNVRLLKPLVPNASDGAALGSTSLMWSDLFLAATGVINWNNGDVTATHSTNTLAFAGASSGYSFDADVTITGKVKQAQPSFSVHKNGSNQTSLTDDNYTAITWSTEVYDIGGFFASNAWTPPAGKIFLTAQIHMTGTISAGGINACGIFKNGSLFRQGITYASSILAVAASISIEDIANGTDAYSVQAYVDCSAGTGTADGTATNTYFMGHWIGA